MVTNETNFHLFSCFHMFKFCLGFYRITKTESELECIRSENFNENRSLVLRRNSSKNNYLFQQSNGNHIITFILIS